MSTSEPRPGERILDVDVTEHALVVDLADGRTLSVPLAWYPRLLHATPEPRAKCVLVADSLRRRAACVVSLPHT